MKHPFMQESFQNKPLPSIITQFESNTNNRNSKLPSRHGKSSNNNGSRKRNKNTFDINMEHFDNMDNSPSSPIKKLRTSNGTCKAIYKRDEKEYDEQISKGDLKRLWGDKTPTTRNVGHYNTNIGDITYVHYNEEGEAQYAYTRDLMDNGQYFEWREGLTTHDRFVYKKNGICNLKNIDKPRDQKAIKAFKKCADNAKQQIQRTNNASKGKD